MAGLRALKTALERGAFDRVYAFHGDDEFRKDEALKALVAAATDPATRDFNCEIRRGPELDPGSLTSLLESLPMLAERRLVAIKDAGGLKKAARAVLDRYLANPGAETVLVLLFPADDEPDKAIAGAATMVAFPHLEGDELASWLQKRAAQAGGSITPEGATLLASHVGGELAQLAGEVEKLLAYTNGALVDEAAVRAVVGIRRGESMADLLDRFVQRDVAGAAALVEHVLQQPKSSGVTLVMALATHVYAIGWMLAKRAQGSNPGQLVGEGFTFLKLGAGFTGRPWGELLQACVKALPKWDAARVDRALTALLAADRALKESRVSSEEQVIVGALLQAA